MKSITKTLVGILLLPIISVSIYGQTNKLENTGNVGIGTTNPSDFLEVAGNLGGKGIKINSSTGAGLTLDRNTIGNNANLRFATSDVIFANFGADNDNTNNLYWGNNGSFSIKYMTLQEGGNVGIGTTNPQSKLDISQGYLRLDNGFGIESDAGASIFTGTGGKTFSIKAGSSTGQIANFIDGNGTTRVTFNSVGNVGIGTIEPIGKLDIGGLSYLRAAPTHSTISEQLRMGRSDLDIRYHSIFSNHTGTPSSNFLEFRIHNGGGANNTNQISTMTLTGEGNVGIGTTNPIDKLTLSGGDMTIGKTTNQEYNIWFRPGDNSPRSSVIGYSSSNVANDYIGMKTRWGSIRFITNDGNEVVRITDSERVGIGTDDPQSKLAVNGQIRATEVKVLADISVPDYVFESDYDLRTLQETKEYITENKHLPEIPSAAEIGENGIDLGDMNMRLLKKIEELTLYQIQLMEEMEEMKKELKELKNK